MERTRDCLVYRWGQADPAVCEELELPAGWGTKKWKQGGVSFNSLFRSKDDTKGQNQL